MEILSVSAMRKKRKRVSAKPKKAAVEKFISLLDASDAEKRMMLNAADLWYELKLAIDAMEGPRAITYGERVNQSLTHMNVQIWMQKQSHKLKTARENRRRTAPKARARLDWMVCEGKSIDECAIAEWGCADESLVKARAKKMRPMIVENLQAFAALAGLPGAN
jgi:hypothetical protein